MLSPNCNQHNLTWYHCEYWNDILDVPFSFTITRVAWKSHCSVCVTSKSKGEIYFVQPWHLNNMKTFIGIGIFYVILNVFNYYLEGFQLWIPCDNLVPSFRKLPISKLKNGVTGCKLCSIERRVASESSIHPCDTRRDCQISWASDSRFCRSCDFNAPVRSQVESKKWLEKCILVAS